ncbi:MAG: adenosine deaminase [Bacteroidota bacterium]|nr:adenosine deaminase [Bacteroidota bacterium]
MEVSFQQALKNHDLRAIRKVPKSDLHNHSLMGGRLQDLEKFAGRKINRFHYGKEGIQGINRWLVEEFRNVIRMPGAFDKALEAAFLQAKSDGVTVLEMTMDVGIGKLLNISSQQIVDSLRNIHQKIAPEIIFRPELGFPRNLPVRTLLAWFEPFLDLDYFCAIDLYDDEFSQPVKNFREIYAYARSIGMKCKAHAGEFNDAEAVRETIEVLQPDVIQHGIAAASSDDVMKILAERKIQLNVCPASNIALKRVKSYKTHPIRILFDHGVKVTVNTDDVLLFNKGNSEQYLQMYRSGLFNEKELDMIRENGLFS